MVRRTVFCRSFDHKTRRLSYCILSSLGITSWVYSINGGSSERNACQPPHTWSGLQISRPTWKSVTIRNSLLWLEHQCHFLRSNAAKFCNLLEHSNATKAIKHSHRWAKQFHNDLPGGFSGNFFSIQFKRFAEARKMVLQILQIDNESTLWVLSNRLPRFIYDRYNSHEFNFNIFRAKVSTALSGSSCLTWIIAEWFFSFPCDLHQQLLSCVVFFHLDFSSCKSFKLSLLQRSKLLLIVPHSMLLLLRARWKCFKIQVV